MSEFSHRDLNFDFSDLHPTYVRRTTSLCRSSFLRRKSAPQMGSIEIMGDITLVPNILFYSRSADHLSRLQHWTSELKFAYNSLEAHQSEEGARIIRQLELILVDRFRCQGIRSTDVLGTTKLMHSYLTNLSQERQKL